MAPESRDSSAHRGERAAQAEAAHREAYDYWGYLFKEDKCGMPLLDRLLKGIAEVISKRFEPSECADLMPSQLAAWYRDVGGDYDVLFNETPSSSIAFIYRSLGAFHSLQPAPGDDGYASPTVPALKKQGFVTWQTIQLLLGPEEHVPFLQRAVEKYDVVDAETGALFPKILPKACFPDCPDDAMETWYQGVAARLKREAEEEARGRHGTDETDPRTSTDTGEASSADEKHGAFRYFEDPLYRNARSRPTFLHRVSKQAARPVDIRTVTSRVRHMLNPWSNRCRDLPGRYETDSESDEEATPIAPSPPSAPRYARHRRPHEPPAQPPQPPPRPPQPPPRPSRPPSRGNDSTDSDSDPERLPTRRRTPVLRSHRSHDLPTSSPHEYFPAYQDARRYSHQNEPSARMDARSPAATSPSPQPMYRPTTSPLFATQVAQQLQARKYYDHHRPTMPDRSSYRPVSHGVRWSPAAAVPVSPPRNVEAMYARERVRDRRTGDAAWYDRQHGGGGGYSRARRRRSTEDAAYARARDRDSGRTRSHDRAWNEDTARYGGRGSRWRGHWDELEGEWARRGGGGGSGHGSRERDAEHRTHRYVGGAHNGAAGRRYPVVSGAY